MTPETVAARLEAVAQELRSNSGRIRWICAVFFAEAGCDEVDPGGHVLRISRSDADPAELAGAMAEATGKCGQAVIPVSL